MNAKENESKIRDLQIFLIQRFILAAAFIFVCQQLISIFYSHVFLYVVNDILGAGQMEYGGNALLAAGELLLVAFSSVIGRYLPDVLSDSITQFMSNTLHIRLRAPAFVAEYGDSIIMMYYITLIMLTIIQLIITLIPYVLAAWWYIVNVSKKMQVIREDDKKQRAEFDKQRNLLFSDIVHDVKTPITTVVGYSQALLDGMADDPIKQREYLEAIHGKSLRISDLISTLFEYVKLDSAGFELHPEMYDLAELVRECVIIHFMDFEEKGLVIDFDIPEERSMAYVDRMQMSRVVTNLLTNTIRYLSPGDHVLLSMKEVIDSGRDMYLISCADDGIAIEDGLINTIFNPFSRGDKARSTKGGSGLGLSIAHKVAAMHGGELRLNQPCGGGYTKAFEIYVPIPIEEEDI